MNSTDGPTASSLEAAQLSAAFAALHQHSEHLVAICTGSDARAAYVNPAGRVLLGVSQTQPAESIDILGLFSDSTSGEIRAMLVEDTNSARVWKGTTSIKSTRTPTAAIIAVRPPGERLLVVSARDVSFLHKMRETYEEEHNLLTALLESMPDSIYFKDLQSRFIRVSQAMATKHRGCRREELVGLTDFDTCGIEHAQKAFDDEQQIIQTSQPLINIEEKETWQDGRVTWVSTSKMPLSDTNGKVIGTFGISRDITEQKLANERLEATRKELLDASRIAGMAEIASGVLHNIGNALNSVNTSVVLLGEHLNRTRVRNLAKAVALLDAHAEDLPRFLTQDDRGRRLPEYLGQLSESLTAEHEDLRKELDRIRLSVDHIKEVVAMQQNYARVSAPVEEASPFILVEEALHISEMSLQRHGIEVRLEVTDAPKVHVSRHKVLQILVNFIRNAKHALDDSGRTDKVVTISIRDTGRGAVEFAVADNGVGIAPEVLSRMFNFGFSTRKNGHGFGLHSSANTAKELGGLVRAESDGPGKGARFILELPTAPPAHSVQQLKGAA